MSVSEWIGEVLRIGVSYLLKRCGGDYFRRGSFTETIDELPPRARLNGRLGPISLRSRRHLRISMADRALLIRRLGPANVG